MGIKNNIGQEKRKMNSEALRHKMYQLLASQKLAVLSTSDKGGDPYADLVAFYCSPDLRILYFSTPRATRKYHNLMNHPQVAFLVDSRANQEEDFHQAAALTVLGWCEEVTEEKKADAAKPYLEKHPYLEAFVAAPTTAFFAVHVEKYIYVSHFQEVFEYQVGGGSSFAP